jgi:hypothetical protein
MVFRHYSPGTGLLTAPGLLPFSSKYQHNHGGKACVWKHGKETGVFPGLFYLSLWVFRSFVLVEKGHYMNELLSFHSLFPETQET